MVNNSENATILVVDDTEQNVRLLAHVLKKEGYEILAAFSGKDALELVEKKKPEIILLDVMMPDMNGFEVCRALKKKASTRDIPVIFLSALSEIDSKVKGFKAGGVDYITKPFQREEVLARIDLHVRLTRLQNQLEEKIEALQEREERLNELNRQKDDLMRVVSHDIRNPVTGIIGVAQLLKESHDSLSEDDQVTMFQTIEDSGRKIQKMVNDLLQKDVAEKGIGRLKKEKVNLDELVNSVVKLHQPTALTKQISFDLDLESKIQLDLDRQKMDQVLGNLISNALKFTPDGGVVSIRLQDNSNDHVKIKISDNGIGIPKEKLENLFNDTRNEIQRAGTKGEEGSGIGLGIIKQFTELHGGEVQVDSKEGEGTTFTIVLPK